MQVFTVSYTMALKNKYLWESLSSATRREEIHSILGGTKLGSAWQLVNRLNIFDWIKPLGFGEK